MNEDWIKFLNEVKSECEARGIPFPINIIPYDNPLEGESGYNVFAVFKDATGEVEKEVAVNPMTRFADPIKDIRIITEDIEPYSHLVAAWLEKHGYDVEKGNVNMSVENIVKNDPRVAAMWAECKEAGIVADINERWEKGIPHHPKAEELFDLLQKSDWAFGGDYFCWKAGGDGDNGETLMFSLSVMLELQDYRKRKSESKDGV